MIDEVLQYLKDNFYLASTPNGLVITNKFTRELGISPSNTNLVPTIPGLTSGKVAIGKPGLSIPIDKGVYKQFIIDANVPTKIETSNGAYWANRYSESGFKSYKKVMENPAINRAILLAATKWYYAQTRTARKMIGTYFSEGIWESCYDDFVKAKDNNKIKPDEGNESNSLRL